MLSSGVECSRVKAQSGRPSFCKTEGHNQQRISPSRVCVCACPAALGIQRCAWKCSSQLPTMTTSREATLTPTLHRPTMAQDGQLKIAQALM